MEKCSEPLTHEQWRIKEGLDAPNTRLATTDLVGIWNATDREGRRWSHPRDGEQDGGPIRRKPRVFNL